MRGWALDLGTTNTGIACWDEARGQPRLIDLQQVCRQPGGENPLEAPALVPSVVEFVTAKTLLDRIGAWRPLERWQ